MHTIAFLYSANYFSSPVKFRTFLSFSLYLKLEILYRLNSDASYLIFLIAYINIFFYIKDIFNISFFYCSFWILLMIVKLSLVSQLILNCYYFPIMDFVSLFRHISDILCKKIMIYFSSLGNFFFILLILISM